MTTFLDGPAAGQTLMLRRAPMFLRVTAAHGAFDALDQLEDKPRPEEYVYVYKITGNPGRVHINRGKQGSGWYTMAEYKIVPVQPGQDVLKHADNWHNWVMSQPEARRA